LTRVEHAIVFLLVDRKWSHVLFDIKERIHNE